MNAAVEDGEARGEARGRTETLREIARALLSKGLSEDFIFEATGLHLDDLS